MCVHSLLGGDLGDKGREGTRGNWKGIPSGFPSSFLSSVAPRAGGGCPWALLIHARILQTWGYFRISQGGAERSVCVGGGSRLPRTESGVEVCGRFGFDPSPPRKARRSGSKGWRGRLPFRKEGGASRRAQGARKPALAGADLGFEAERAG